MVTFTTHKAVLDPDQDAHTALLELLIMYREVCDQVVAAAKFLKTRSRTKLHKELYAILRREYPGLGAQMICNAIYAVATDLKQHTIVDVRKTIIFDVNTCSVSPAIINLYTMSGRVKVPYTGDTLDGRIVKAMLTVSGSSWLFEAQIGSDDG